MSDRERQGAGLIAAVPAAFIVAAEGLAWILTAIIDAEGPVTAGAYLLIVAVFAGVAAPVVIVATRRQDAWMWAGISICLTAVGLGLGFLLWVGAATVTCGGVDGCFG